jgi:tripartite ATP-independent transporter DctP family solute receptor
MNKFKRVFIVVVTMAMILSGCGNSSGVQSSASGSSSASNQENSKAIHLKFSTAVSEKSSWHKGALKFAELVNERTNGKYVVDIYPVDQLTSGNQVKALEALQTGATDFDIRSILLYTNFDAKFTAIMMPWMVPTYEKADEVMNGEGGAAIAELVNSYGMKFLAFGESGYRQITNNKRPITSPKDLKDIKLRVPALNMYFDMFTQFGANPTTMNMSEVFAAIQQGTVDGQENPVDVIRSYKVNEVCKYITLWNCSYDPIVMSMSPALYQKLSDEEKGIIETCAKEAMDYQKQLAREEYKSIVEEFAKTSEVNELTPEQLEEFRTAVAPVYDSWVEKIGVDFMKKFGYVK